MKKYDTKPATEPVAKSGDPAREPTRDDARKLPALDFAKLDLRVEKVEERISPSETNVFDK